MANFLVNLKLWDKILANTIIARIVSRHLCAYLKWDKNNNHIYEFY